MKVICFDIGGTNLRAALINDKYEVLKVNKVPTLHQGNDILIAQIVALIHEMSEGEKEICNVVFGVPGRVSKHNFYIDELPNVGVKNLDLKAAIGEVFPHLTVYVYNDAEIAGLYEATVGKGRGYKRVYYVTISTGLGACLFVNKVWTPSSYEVGHTLVPYNGSYYELEHIASGTGLVKLASLNNLSITSSKAFFEGFKMQMPLFANTFEEWMKVLSEFFRSTYDLFEPEVVVIGGGVAFCADYFIHSLRRRNKYMKFEISSKIDDAGLLGCVSLIELIKKNKNPFENE